MTEENKIQADQELIPNSVLERLAHSLREVVSHEVDVITDSDWFEELVERKVKEIMDRRYVS
jgi:hypothetical protein